MPEMTLELKDILYFTWFGITISAIWFTFKSRVRNVEEALSDHKKIIFKESGELALITTEVCRFRQELIQKSISKYDVSLDKVLERLEDLSKDVLVIMVHLDIDAKEHGGNRATK